MFLIVISICVSGILLELTKADTDINNVVVTYCAYSLSTKFESSRDAIASTPVALKFHAQIRIWRRQGDFSARPNSFRHK